MRAKRLLPALLLPLAACGGSPTGPSVTPPGDLDTVVLVLFYDENGNGQAEPNESVRLPGVGVSIGGRGAVSGPDGHFTVGDVPAGVRSATLLADSLPAYWMPGAAPSVTVPTPGGFTLSLGATLPIGANRPNVYMAFGDSITLGDGSSSHSGYRGELAAELRAHFGRAELVNEGATGTRSDAGAARLPGTLSRVRPAYALIVYGTNDWNNAGCRDVPNCFTIRSLESMILTARGASSVPVVATLIPANPAYTDRMAGERNNWIKATNDAIRGLVAQERAVLADPWSVFMREAGDNLPSLFSDHVHPNDRGYSLMAGEFTRAITAPSRQR